MYDSDIFIAGCGLTGVSAAIFAHEKGLSISQAGSTAEILFLSGLLDVYGNAKPFNSIEALQAINPLHPYAKIGAEKTRLALDSFLNFLEKKGMPFKHFSESSCKVLTPMGTNKFTWAIPETFAYGVEAITKKLPTLIVDFHGYREFSAYQVAEVAKKILPHIKPIKIQFPTELPQPLLTGTMAQALELPKHVDALAELLKPHITDVACVGLPAVLGVHNAYENVKRLTQILGIPVFEIATMPTSVPGLRLKNLFDTLLEEQNKHMFKLSKVHKIEKKEKKGKKGFEVSINTATGSEKVFVKKVLLASGRFISNGLIADRLEGVKEAIMDLPVHQPISRETWYNDNLFNRDGHPINYSGVMVNNSFNPINHKQEVIDKDIYAAGTMLAHHDWVREKCGAGLSISTAYAAIENMAYNY